MEVPVKVAPEETEAPAAAASAHDKPAPPAAPTAPTTTPVMDVRPPEAAPAPESPKPAPEQTKPAPAPAGLKKDAKLAEPKPAKVITPKKPRQPGVGMAIFASVVIVLGLAALAVYAYLKTN